MNRYPKELLPLPEYKLLSDASVLTCSFVRETDKDIYALINEGIELDYLVQEIIGQKRTKKEVFEMSLFLYGYYTEEHVGITVDDKGSTDTDWEEGKSVSDTICYHMAEKKALYLFAAALHNKTLTFENTKYVLSFEHKPNIVNFWHFQLFTDENNVRLARDIKPGRYDRLAKDILKTIVAKAICRDKKNIVPFKFEQDE